MRELSHLVSATDTDRNPGLFSARLGCFPAPHCRLGLSQVERLAVECVLLGKTSPSVLRFDSPQPRFGAQYSVSNWWHNSEGGF